MLRGVGGETLQAAAQARFRRLGVVGLTGRREPPSEANLDRQEREGHQPQSHDPTPQPAPAKLVEYVKGRSSRRLQEEFPHLGKRYWGQHLWARGYFCATVGAGDEKTILEYIENQKWDQDDQGFKITAPNEP